MQLGITRNQKTYFLVAGVTLLVFGSGIKVVETASPYLPIWDVASWFKAPRRPLRRIPAAAPTTVHRQPKPQATPVRQQPVEPYVVTLLMRNMRSETIQVCFRGECGKVGPGNTWKHEWARDFHPNKVWVVKTLGSEVLQTIKRPRTDKLVRIQ